MPAPVALFVYNRLWHTRRTIEALKANSQADKTALHIFSDGPKTEADAPKVHEVRDYIRSITDFGAVIIKENNTNQGLARSIIAGVSEVLKNHDTVVVLEDDMVTSPYFLTYMNDSLDLYKDDEEVISIHGYIYPVKETLPETFFLKGADCWGWATWKRGWSLFEEDGNKLLKELKHKNLTSDFDFNGSYPYTRMLEKQISGENNSWAIRWYAAAYLKNKITLYPGKSLVRNIGNDTSGTHSWDSKRYDQLELARTIDLRRIKTEPNSLAREVIAGYFRSTTPSLYKKIISRIKFKLR